VSGVRAAPTFATETVDLLGRLNRVDTTNPPGNETLAAELLRDDGPSLATSAFSAAGRAGRESAATLLA
jgi:hypothetical protein